MSNYGWFNVKVIGLFALIAFAVWITGSGMPMWALLLLPSYHDDEDDYDSREYDHE
jgi:hypothetical protein